MRRGVRRGSDAATEAAMERAGIGAGLASGMVGGVGGALSSGARGIGSLAEGMSGAKMNDEDQERMIQEKAMRMQEMAKEPYGMKKGGKVKKMKSGGYVKSADGCAQRGKTKGRFV